MKRGLMMAGLAIVACHSPAKAADVALTIDDIPQLTIINDAAGLERFNARLLRALHHNRLPATGFVIGREVSGPGKAVERRIVELWRKRRIELGNHTFSHESPNKLGAAGYTADIAEGEKALEGLVPSPQGKPRWFRPPYLETGSPSPVRQEITEWLACQHIAMAPVTMENSDYVFAAVYEKALRAKNKARARSVRLAYLEYTEAMIDWYRSASHDLFGRDIAYVMLIHDTRLNADCLDDLVRLFTKADLHFVPLEQAMADPAYATKDNYSGPEGLDWLHRWSLQMNKPLDWDHYRDPPEAIQQDYDQLLDVPGQ